jgi:hypothetical protein
VVTIEDGIVETARTVAFVCLHGAKKSRLAAAFFNAGPPPGWRAASAGLHPQEAVSEEAVRLVVGTDAEALLDHTGPRPLAAIPAPDLVVAIDCEVGGARRWDLVHDEGGVAMRDELAIRAAELVREMTDAQH